MERYDIALYGHLTVDTIFFSDFTQKRTLGAMGNIWEAILKENSLLSINLQPMSLGEAIILVDNKKGTRLGRGKLNLKTRKATPQNAKWHHIMYLNQLDDVSFIKEINRGLISVDITSGKMKNLEMLKYVDYMFISDEDIFMNINELASLARGWVILHYPTGSIITNGKETFETKVKAIKNLNVLGAGDYFAGVFISNLVAHPTMDLRECVRIAHEKTSIILQETNG